MELSITLKALITSAFFLNTYNFIAQQATSFLNTDHCNTAGYVFLYPHTTTGYVLRTVSNTHSYNNTSNTHCRSLLVVCRTPTYICILSTVCSTTLCKHTGNVTQYKDGLSLQTCRHSICHLPRAFVYIRI